MERAELDQLVQRLVDHPHDEEALGRAHEAGNDDPKSYAMLLERVGNETPDPVYAAYWLAQAGNVWITTLGDAHRGARTLMTAIEKDPTAPEAAERLAELYREKNDTKALVALLDRRAKALAPLAVEDGDVRDQLAGMYEELGQLWAAPPLEQPKKAIDSYRKAYELDPSSAYAIFNLRELYKLTEDWSNALPLYAAELAVEQDPARRVGLFRDEASTRRLAGDLRGATRALAEARAIDDGDPTLQQEYASSILDRIHADELVEPEERREAVAILLELAEAYDAEHGLAYAGAVLDIDKGNDQGLELYLRHARALDDLADVPTRCAAYLAANPNGALADEARVEAQREESLEDVSNEIEAIDDPRASQETSERPALEQELFAPASATKRPSRIPQEFSTVPPTTDDDGERLSRRAPPLSPDKLQGVLDAAQMLVSKGKKAEAFAKYKEVLDTDPAHSEALAWAEDYLRSKRDYAQLRDVLLAAIRATASIPEHLESRKERLREVAGLCESNLRDVDGAVAAWRQLRALDRTDESAGTALMRLLERSQRWDDLANLLEQEATIEQDVDTKVQLEKRLAKLHEEKRKDPIAAGDAYGRIARLLPDDDQTILTAARLFEKGERADLAAAIIDETAKTIEDPVARGHLMEKLAALHEQLGDGVTAGDAYMQAAEALRNPKGWEEAERLYAASEAWERAANAAHQRGLTAGDSKQQAGHLARAADYLTKAGLTDRALERLEEATNLDPLNDDYAEQLAARYTAGDRIGKLVEFLQKRGDRLSDRAKRVNVRREAALLAAHRIGDRERARELWLKLLEDGDDKEALERLIDDAVEREDHNEATTLLRRLGQNTVDKAEKARVALREAELLADGVGDVETALSRYEVILADLDPTCRPALQAIADLQEARENHAAAADALERELKLVADVQERGQIAGRLARLYEKLDDPRSAIRALDLVRKADLEDFDALTRLCELCELTEQWGRVAELLVERIEIEADEKEAIELTRKLATILADKLERGDEALGALTDLADAGNADVRQAYIELGDRLGWKGIVAGKLKEWWFDARNGAERTAALRGAFDRFAEVGRDADAVVVGVELVRTKGADHAIAQHLEELAVKTSDEDALEVAHELLAREVQGEARAVELVRQAEVRVRAGLSRGEAIAHGEQGLSLVTGADVDPLLERLAALAAKPGEVIDLYERQVTRSKAPNDRVRALARAAQVAATRGQPERARAFFELALAAVPSDETLAMLEESAREGDKQSGGDRLRRALCQGLAAGGHGARDGGRTRAGLLRRAAILAHKELGDLDQAFAWLGDALVAHVDPETLDQIETLGAASGDPKRAESSLTHALGEVFDGPLVRQLLARRAKLRVEHLSDRAGAAADLKKLHDLSPNDQAVIDELAALLMGLSDYKTLAQLYEDQILRGKDLNARADLARRIARIWEEQLKDPRETADAWRRVLRLKNGDAEATEGLERAKSGADALKKPEGDPLERYAPPKLISENPSFRPERASVKPMPAAAPAAPTKAPSKSPGPPPDEASALALASSDLLDVGDSRTELSSAPPPSEAEDAGAEERAAEGDESPHARATRRALVETDDDSVPADLAMADVATSDEDDATHAVEPRLAATGEASATDAEPALDPLTSTAETDSTALAASETARPSTPRTSPTSDDPDDATGATTETAVDPSKLSNEFRTVEPAVSPSRPPRSVPPPLPLGAGVRQGSMPPPLPNTDVATTFATLDARPSQRPNPPRPRPSSPMLGDNTATEVPFERRNPLIPNLESAPEALLSADLQYVSTHDVEELASADVLDAEELTSSHLSIESLPSEDEPDEVVVADDFAEIDDEDEDEDELDP